MHEDRTTRMLLNARELLVFSLPHGQNTLWGTTRPLYGNRERPERELQAGGVFRRTRHIGFCVKNDKYIYVCANFLLHGLRPEHPTKSL